MFHIGTQQIGNEVRHAVTGEVGSSLITILATSEIKACEIARCLNEAAGIEVEDLVEVADAADLHSAMEGILNRNAQAADRAAIGRGFREACAEMLRGAIYDKRPNYADIRDSAPEVTPEEEAAWRAISKAGDDDGPRPPREGETLALAEQLAETQLRG